jgi:hypothetical protein
MKQLFLLTLAPALAWCFLKRVALVAIVPVVCEYCWTVVAVRVLMLRIKFIKLSKSFKIK